MMLGTVLRGWRKHHGLTLKEAAVAIGLSKSVLSRIENGGSTTSEALIHILIWLHGSGRPLPNPPTMEGGG